MAARSFRGALLLLLLCGGLQARVQFFFNALGDDLVAEVMRVLSHAEQRAQRGRPASIDISMFQFSHRGLAEEIARLASSYPELQIRLILDMSEMATSGKGAGVWLEAVKDHRWNDAALLWVGRRSEQKEERAAYRERLRDAYGSGEMDNLEIKYKWYPEAYIWDEDRGRPRLEHGLSLLLHHKACIVNGQELIAGSFNWSPQAAEDNYEHLKIFSGVQERPVVDAYQAEFDAMWADEDNFKPAEEARELRKQLLNEMFREHGGR